LRDRGFDRDRAVLVLRDGVIRQAANSRAWQVDPPVAWRAPVADARVIQIGRQVAIVQQIIEPDRRLRFVRWPLSALYGARGRAHGWTFRKLTTHTHGSELTP